MAEGKMDSGCDSMEFPFLSDLLTITIETANSNDDLAVVRLADFGPAHVWQILFVFSTCHKGLVCASARDATTEASINVNAVRRRNIDTSGDPRLRFGAATRSRSA
jgi:hypothetical protein